MVAGLLVTAGLILGVGPVAPASASAAGEFTTFDEIDGSSAPIGLAKGPDGSMWFTEWGGNRIGRITAAGATTEFEVPTTGANPVGIAAGPDGAMWFTEFTGNKIGRIAMDGTFTEFAVPTAGALRAGAGAGSGYLSFRKSSHSSRLARGWLEAGFTLEDMGARWGLTLWGTADVEARPSPSPAEVVQAY